MTTAIFLLIVTLNGKQGVIDYDGNIVIPIEYDKIYLSSGNNYYLAGKYIEQEDSTDLMQYGIIDLEGKILEPFIHKNSNFYSPHINYTMEYSFVTKDEKLCIIDTNRNVVFENKYYDRFVSFHNGMLTVTKNRKIGFLNSDFEEVIPPTYKNASPFKDDGISNVIFEDNSQGFINTNGKVVSKIPASYTFGHDYKKGIYRAFNRSNKFYCSLFDIKGNQIVKDKYKEIFFSVEDGIIIYQGDNMETGKSDLIYCDTSGKIIKEFNYDKIQGGKKNRIIFGEQIGNSLLFGIADKNGNVLLRPQYEELKYMIRYEDNNESLFDEDILLAKKNGKYGVVKENNEVLVTFEYPKLRHLNNGFFRDDTQEGSIIVNHKDEFLLRTDDFWIWYQIKHSIDEYAAKTSDNKYGIYNLRTGEWRIQPIYDNIGWVEEIKIEK